MPAATWGPYPGHTPQDIQSGAGIVRNSLLIENVEKTVAWGRWGSTALMINTNFEMLCRGMSRFFGCGWGDTTPLPLAPLHFAACWLHTVAGE